MILFKIFQEFLLPSVFVLVLLLAGAILIFRLRKRKFGEILIILGIVLYYLFSITPVADLILAPLESRYKQIEAGELAKSDKIVLLLGGKESNVLRASEVLRISNPESQKAKIIISGTDPLNPGKKEAEEVKKNLIERGMPSENIILEEKSRNTFESAKNTKEILNEEPFFLVTSAYHLPRAMETFQKARTNPIPAPADFKVKKDYDILDFFPNAENLINSDLAFHEYFGILFYRLKY
jgi:uncharacterized SAM-binding protein YcdF (DUF218 family)